MRIEGPLRRNAQRHSKLPKIPVIEGKNPCSGLENCCFGGDPFPGFWQQSCGFPCVADVSNSRSRPIFPVNIPVNGICQRKVRTKLDPQPVPRLPALSATNPKYRYSSGRCSHQFILCRRDNRLSVDVCPRSVRFSPGANFVVHNFVDWFESETVPAQSRKNSPVHIRRIFRI